jgi:thioredoxin reductase
LATKPAWDVIIIGAGPAGLSAALVLGRCRRRVLVVDANQPRNAVARALHGFLSRDGIAPKDLVRIGREQLCAYPSVELRGATASRTRIIREHFEITLDSEVKVYSRKLVFATGVVDQVPEVEGARSFYGKGVYHCPYCDGCENRNEPTVAYGQGTKGLELARTLLAWTADIVLCTDGPARLPTTIRRQLERHGVVVRKERIRRLEGSGHLAQVVFESGEALPRTAFFFNTDQGQRSDLPALLGCKVDKSGAVVTNEDGHTSVDGAYLAGDATKDLQLAVMAAATGAQTAFAINKALIQADFR